MRLSGICLDYGQVAALKDVSLSLAPGKVHAVVGEHGAGKSSLGMVISGNVRPSAGRIVFEAMSHEFLTTASAHRLGIEMVYQQVQLNEYFSVAENLFFLDKARTRHGLVSRKALQRRAEAFLSSHGFNLDPAAPVKRLNLPERVLLSILGCLQKGPRLLILDEALERLSSPDFAKVLSMIESMKADGMAVLFITHRIDDVYGLADRVSIVKEGEILVTDDVERIDKMNLLKLTYTQVYSLQESRNRKREFNQFLKYNEAVLLGLPVNLIVVDVSERVKIVNEHCKRYFHLEGVAFANEPLERLLGVDNAAPLKLIRRALGSDHGSAFYHVPLTIDGAETVNNIRTLPIYDEGELIGSIVIIEDITEFDKLQRQVILSEKLASVGMLAAGVAHEINNPLEIIYNYLRYMRVTFEDAALHAAVDDLHEEITYIAGIVRNLLSLAGTDEQGREELELNELLRSTLALLRHNAAYQNIAIQFCSSRKELFLTANRNEMKQVVLNLVKNSFEAMPGGGEIRIETSLVDDRGLTIGTDPNGRPTGQVPASERLEHTDVAESAISARPQAVRLVFTDTGPGIKDANLTNVFIPFYSTGKGPGAHVGLGLSLCYGIVQRHHGTITVENLDPGCRFTITLPVRGGEEPE